MPRQAAQHGMVHHHQTLLTLMFKPTAGIRALNKVHHTQHTADGPWRMHLVTALTLSPHQEGQHQGPLPKIMMQAAEAHPEASRFSSLGTITRWGDSSSREVSREGWPTCSASGRGRGGLCSIVAGLSPSNTTNPPPVAGEIMAGQGKPQKETPRPQHPLP